MMCQTALKKSITYEETVKPDLPEMTAGELRSAGFRKAKRLPKVERNIRQDRAHSLCYAIQDTHPDDARQLLTAALVDLSAGAPIPGFLNIREDARWWAGMATPAELMEYMIAASLELGDKALAVKMRKQLFMRLWERFSRADQAAFLQRVNPPSSAQGASNDG